MINHLTRFSASCVIKSKSKKIIVKKIFQIWISISGSPKKFLVDNRGEFNNHEFISLCENVNIHICTMAAEPPWSNGLVERHNAILEYTVAKTIDDVKCDLELALSLATAAKNSLKNINEFSPNQMVFGKNPNFPVSLNSNLPAFGVTSSQVVADNLDAMHAARQAFIRNESSGKVMHALTHQIRTSRDDNIHHRRLGVNTS